LQRVLAASVGTLGPVFEALPDFVTESDGLPSSVVMVAHRIGTTHSYFTGIPDVYRSHGMYATQKFVEPFSNNVVSGFCAPVSVLFVFFPPLLVLVLLASLPLSRSLALSFSLSPLLSLSLSFSLALWFSVAHTQVIFTFLLRRLVSSDASVDLPTRLAGIAKDASLHFVLPRNSLTPLLSKGVRRWARLYIYICMCVCVTACGWVCVLETCFHQSLSLVSL
jgi:hypothetical protein